MTKAVRVHKTGGPETLVYEDVDVPAPAAGEIRIRQHAVGVNFIDVYYRTGLYKAPSLPFIVGNEAAGEVVSVGPGVTNFHPGDRVAYYTNLGGYANERNVAWEKLVKLPDHITYEQGAVLMLKGLTVWYLLHKTFKVEPHHRVLIHAAAGGIGLLACQWARALGAHVIGTVGSRAKADLALANGCDHVILYNDEDFVARLRDETKGADVVFDIMGASYLDRNIDALATDGQLVIIGMQGGVKGELNLGKLLVKRARVIGTTLRGRPVSGPNSKSEIVAAVTASVWPMIADGRVRPVIGAVFPVQEAADAHKALADGDVVGKVMLRIE